MTELLRPRETRATTAGLAAAAELHANRAESPNRKVTACIADAAHLLALLLLSMYIPLDARETCHVKFDGHRNALFSSSRSARPVSSNSRLGVNGTRLTVPARVCGGGAAVDRQVGHGAHDAPGPDVQIRPRTSMRATDVLRDW